MQIQNYYQIRNYRRIIKFRNYQFNIQWSFKFNFLKYEVSNVISLFSSYSNQ